MEWIEHDGKNAICPVDNETDIRVRYRFGRERDEGFPEFLRWKHDGTESDIIAYHVYKKDEVNSPNHYTKGEVECIEAIRAALTPEEFEGYLKGNVFKYIWREKYKGGKQSLEKAQWYLNKLVEVW